MGKPYIRHSSVLVIDDNPTSLASVCTTLRLRGFEVSSASGSAEALGQLMTKEYLDLVLVGMDMPEMDGVAFATGLRRTDRFQSTRILMMSDHIEPPKSFCTIGQGERVLVLQKPIAPEVLVDEAIAAIASIPR